MYDQTVFGVTFAYNEKQQYIWFQQAWRKGDYLRMVSEMNLELQGILGENIEAVHNMKVSGADADPEEVKRVYGRAEAIARLAKQMVNNADVVLRKDKLQADGKIGKGDAISKLVGERWKRGSERSYHTWYIRVRWMTG